MILLPSDVRDAGLFVDKSDSFINMEIAFIENVIVSLGTYRELEITEYEVLVDVTIDSQVIYIPYLPIVNPENLELSVRFKPGRTGQFGSIIQPQFVPIARENFNIQPDGSIDLDLYFGGILFPERLFESNSGKYRTYPKFGEAKLKFESGFDFRDDTNREVLLIKSATLELLRYKQSAEYKGVIKEEANDFYSVEYNRASGFDSNGNRYAGTSAFPKNLLSLFTKYRPLTYVI